VYAGRRGGEGVDVMVVEAVREPVNEAMMMTGMCEDPIVVDRLGFEGVQRGPYGPRGAFHLLISR
jgi:hypothetical protein